MGFSEKDTTAPREIETKAMGVVIRRRESEEGAPVAIFVEFMENGASVNKSVPQDVTDAKWPKMKATLLELIDAAKA